MAPRDPANDLTTAEIATRYGISVVAAGGWFRKGIIPPPYGYQVIAARANGLTALEWRADRHFMATEFQRPSPRGGRHPHPEASPMSTALPTLPTLPTIVLSTGPWSGYSLADIFAADPAALRQIAWGPPPATDLYLQKLAHDFLIAQGEAPPLPTPPVAPPPASPGIVCFQQNYEGTLLTVSWSPAPPATLWQIQTDATTVTCLLPLLDARVLAADLGTGALEQHNIFTFYGGQNEAPGVVSETLVARDRGSVRYPIQLELRRGPGQARPEGIRPRSDAAPVTLTVNLSRYEARKLGLALRDALLLAQLAAL